MANCVDTLEAVLSNADCKLDSIMYQLKSRMCQIETGNGQEGSGDDQQPITMSCAEMIGNLKDIQSDLQELREQHRELHDMENQMNEQLMDKCSKVTENVQKLKNKLNSD
ncbi:uncharacterized protein LOC128953924 [Oppia nitens]|uniref:uncharacterized protein LOC128953924 n=1 Tax=Oppia nitens TaxID=1686743 RepID=UPI0023DBBB3B|nr:uncharacterized protein LOC128953924 [Oppia nitens]